MSSVWVDIYSKGIHISLDTTICTNLECAKKLSWLYSDLFYQLLGLVQGLSLLTANRSTLVVKTSSSVVVPPELKELRV